MKITKKQLKQIIKEEMRGPIGLQREPAPAQGPLRHPHIMQKFGPDIHYGEETYYGGDPAKWDKIAEKAIEEMKLWGPSEWRKSFREKDPRDWWTPGDTTNPYNGYIRMLAQGARKYPEAQALLDAVMEDRELLRRKLNAMMFEGMKITKSQLKQIIKEELQNTLKEAGDPRFLSRSRHTPPRSTGSPQTSLGPETLKRRAPGEPAGGEHGQQEILIWHDGNWHETVLTDEETSEIAAAHDPDVESWGDAAQRVLSSLRGVDIEDVDLS